jgi:hypothetical protein
MKISFGMNANWWLARVGIYMTMVVMSHLLIGLYIFPIDEIIPLETGTSLRQAGAGGVHPALAWAMWTNVALLIASMVLVTLRSKWVLPIFALYLVAAKISWAFTVFLPHYNGDGFALYITLAQVTGLIFTVRATWRTWFPKSAT